MYKVGVLGAGGTAAKNYIKSLRISLQPFHIVGFDIDKYNILLSKCDERVIVSQSEDEKIKTIQEWIPEIDFFHAQPDTEVSFLIRNQHIFGEKIFPYIHSKWEMFANKQHCQTMVCEQLGLDFQSHLVSHIMDHPRMFKTMLERSSGGEVWMRALNGAGSKAALPVSSLSQVIEWGRYWNRKEGLLLSQFIISDFLPGPEYAVQMFWVDGKLYHSQARERMRYIFGNIMPSGQSSSPSLARVVTDQKVYEMAAKTIRILDDQPHGIYGVDMKTSKNGEIIPTEVNYGRFYTTSDFFARIGINTPLAEMLYTVKKLLPLKQINSAPADRMWVRGIDSEPGLITGKWE